MGSLALTGINLAAWYVALDAQHPRDVLHHIKGRMDCQTVLYFHSSASTSLGVLQY